MEATNIIEWYTALHQINLFPLTKQYSEWYDVHRYEKSWYCDFMQNSAVENVMNSSWLICILVSMRPTITFLNLGRIPVCCKSLVHFPCQIDMIINQIVNLVSPTTIFVAIDWCYHNTYFYCEKYTFCQVSIYLMQMIILHMYLHVR